MSVAVQSPAAPLTAGVVRPDARRPLLGWRRLPWWGELLMIGILYVLYEVVRALTPSKPSAADHHADELLDMERWSHIDAELTLNRLLSSVHLRASTAAVYYITLHFIVTPMMLVYLWRRRPDRYADLRSALILTGLVALVVFWVWPVAPPRFRIKGISDTIVNVHLIGSADPHGVSSLINQYAAMPSLHVGWAVWCAFAIIQTGRSRWRHLAWLYPITTSVVVIATANHYVADVIAGAVLAGICVAATSRVRTPRREPDLWADRLDRFELPNSDRQGREATTRPELVSAGRQ